MTQEQDNISVIQPLSLGVQVPGAAQHGFQLILQPSTHSRGEHTAEGRLWATQGTQGKDEGNKRMSLVFFFQEPRPHLFGQMFARLQLLRAVREVFHTGLAMLGLPPLSHI